MIFQNTRGASEALIVGLARLHHFQIFYNNDRIGIDDVMQAVGNELKP